jgi:ABC-2 type transport system ATP-binding protein
MIEVEQLTKRFGATTAVDHLTFTAHPGRVTGFLGPNGAGKSTTMRMILGLDRPTSGRVRINGKPMDALSTPLREIGALIDPSAVDGARSAYNHLLWLAHSNGIERDRVTEVVELVGLTDVASQRVAGFSLGMRQRLGLAAALLGDPQVVMLDEPINGLDPDGIIWVRSLLRQLAADGRTVLVSSHLMEEMAKTADHLIVIGAGRLVADAPIDEVISRHHATSVMVRADRVADLAFHLARHGAAVIPEGADAIIVDNFGAAAIGAIALAEGIALSELTPRHASLEDAFFDLTHDVVQFRAGAETPEGILQ